MSLALGYVFYGKFLARLFRLDPAARMPAGEMKDGVDFVPTPAGYLLGQHFSAIAAAGPITGPILAALLFGWVPALIWILVGAIFIGGVHDFAALVASVRHKAQSIAGIVRAYMSRRAYILFLVFVWFALVYVIIAFTDIVATAFVGVRRVEGFTISGPGIATSSLLYLVLPVIMALVMKYTRIGVGWATVIFVPLVGVAIWIGQYLPFDLAALAGFSDTDAVKVWDVLLLAYCFAASIMPMWVLLQPRGHLGGVLLFVTLAAGVLGVLCGGKNINYPAFIAWTAKNGDTLFPMLFITVACGACSGFHALVATGTTSKQLRCETDAKPIAYGAMLLEGVVAVISLGCVMMLTAEGAKSAGGPNVIYGMGMGSFLGVIGVPAAFGISFGLLAFTTFVYDTLDVSTRLGRYVLQELFGWQNAASRYLATAATVIVPLLFVMRTVTDAKGNPIPAWRVFWPLFGASNQLLATLTLIGITVWLWRKYRAWWAWLVTGLPMAFMFVISMWAIVKIILQGCQGADGAWRVPRDVPTWVAMVLVVLALLLLAEMIVVLGRAQGTGTR